MTIQAGGTRLDSWVHVWDIDTLSWVPWTGAVSGVEGGEGASGTVDQGDAGADPWLVAIDGVPHVVIDSATLGTVAISVAALPLPTGAALEAGNLATIAGKDFATQTTLALIKAKTDNLDVASSTLATGAKQDTGNVSIASLDTKTPALGQALAAGSTPVVLTAAQLTTLTPPAAITGYALEAGHLATIDTSTAKIPSQGQALAAASLPVVLTAIQAATLTPPAAIVGFGLESTQLLQATAGKQDTGNASLASILTELGAKTEPADQQHVVVDSMPAVAANSAADVLEPDGDAGYTYGDLAANLTQTPDGRLRVAVAGLVNDTAESAQAGALMSLSLSGEGRLRVVTSSESYNFTAWGDSETWGSDDAHINGTHPLTAW